VAHASSPEQESRAGEGKHQNIATVTEIEPKSRIRDKGRHQRRHMFSSDVQRSPNSVIRNRRAQNSSSFGNWTCQRNFYQEQMKRVCVLTLSTSPILSDFLTSLVSELEYSEALFERNAQITRVHQSCIIDFVVIDFPEK
jgi:hypothetical protein